MKDIQIKSMGTDCPIDRKRNAAFSMDIGTLGDNSGIDGFITIDSKLHVISKNGIHRFQTADQIDPEGQNINIRVPDILKISD